MSDILRFDAHVRPTVPSDANLRRTIPAPANVRLRAIVVGFVRRIFSQKARIS